jgi:hypothetical protein
MLPEAFPLRADALWIWFTSNSFTLGPLRHPGQGEIALAHWPVASRATAPAHHLGASGRVCEGPALPGEAVALALGLGTMIGWKRIVVTVGEKIGKTHLTYAQGASAEIVAMATIGLADVYGLPVSTTHVLSSGVAGTMAANGSGLQWATIKNMALAWVMTLPAAMLIAGSLYVLLRQVF